MKEEESFLTDAVLSGTCMIGTADELRSRIAGFEAGGLNQIMLLPNFDGKLDVLRDVSEQLFTS